MDGGDTVMAPIDATCSIVGGGPAGTLLALLLARAGVDVVLLEQHTRWDREFRGEGVQPGAIDLFEELGLLSGVLELPHQLADSILIYTEGSAPLFSGSLKEVLAGRRHPYLMQLPQPPFLDWCAKRAVATEHCRLVMGASVRALIVEGEGNQRRVVGVRYEGAEGIGEVRARVVVGCDGRYSVCRREAASLGIQTIPEAPPMDILWTSVSRDRVPDLPAGEIGVGGIWLRDRPEPGLTLLLPTSDADGTRRLQIGWTIPHGSFGALRQRGFAAWKHEFVQAMPGFGPALDAIGGWHDVTLLSVVVQRASPWWTPGLLLLGDAAHTASPVGGQGLNLALVDAAVAAEVLLGALSVPTGDETVLDLALARIQQRREAVARGVMDFQSQFPKFLALPGIVRHSVMGVAPHLGRLAGDRARDVARRMAYGFREGWD